LCGCVKSIITPAGYFFFQVSSSHMELPTAHPLMLRESAVKVTVPLNDMKPGISGCFIFLPFHAAPSCFMP